MTWQTLAPLPAVGARSGAPETQPQITYTPDRAGTAPSGFVWVEGAGIATRRITAVNFDAIVLGQALPDALPAAFAVDRFTLQAPDVTGGSQTSAQMLALNAPAPADAKAFHVIELTGAALAAGTVVASNATLTSDTATIASAAGAGTLLPGQIVVLQNGGNLEAAAVKQLRVTVTLTRNLTLGASGLEAVLLGPSGPTYTGVRRDDRIVRVQPSSGGVATDLPRFAVGELIQVQWTSPSAGERLYRVQFVNGATLTGADDDVIPNTVSNVTVTRLAVQDPGTGSSRLGIDGTAPAPNQVRFNVWAPGAFQLTGNNRLGIVDGQNVFAVSLAAGNQQLDIVFLTTPTIAAPVNVALPAQAATSAPVPPATAGSGFSTLFTADGASLTFLDTPLTSPLTGLILAVPYVETNEATRRANGNLNSGTVRVPNDHENEKIELDRRKALEDHELTHTQQSARYGPFLFAYFPLWVVELIGEFATGAGMPEFGPYVPATVTGGAIEIPAAPGVTIEAGDHVQVAQNGRAVDIELGNKVGDTYTLTSKNIGKLRNGNIANGPAQVRREESGAVEIVEFIVNFMQFFTVGGLMNQVSALGWGAVIWLVTMAIQGIRGLVRNTAHGQIASDHVTITLDPGTQVEGLTTGALLALQQGDKTFVRPVQAIQERTIQLATAAPLTGDVQLSAYTTSSALFPNWHDYYPASYPDPNRPASLKVEKVGTSTLTLAVNDRVHIRSSGGHTFNTVVTSVGADGLVEVEDETLLSSGEDADTVQFFIAKIGEDDPMGFSDQFLLNQLHLGWMQYVNDPFGQIVYRAQPTSLAGKIFARSARYLFSTQGWSVLPFLGYYFYDNAFNQIGDNGHLSHMEQEASHNSGDTYCPIGTLHGDYAVVGDVARYLVTESGGIRDLNPPAHMINLGVQDAPGSNIAQVVALQPTTGGATSGTFVPDAFNLITAGLNNGGIAPRGWVPTNNLLERTTGAYVAFTRPGSHTVTAQNLGGLANSRAAEAKEFPNLITFQRTVQDVTVTLSSLPVAEGATVPLIPYQHAALSVAPDGSRVYRTTLNEPGAIATIDTDLRSILMKGIAAATAPGGLTTENVEVSRFYHFNGTAFDSALGPVHLPADIDIAVRRFRISLIDAISMRAAADLTTALPASLKPGATGILIIPAPIVVASITTSVTGTPSLTPQITPLTPVPAALQGFIGDGGVLNVLFPADQPPEATASVTITIPVGPPGSPPVPVTSQITVDPHFTLDSSTGFQVAPGSPITLHASDNTAIALVGTVAGFHARSALGEPCRDHVDAPTAAREP